MWWGGCVEAMQGMTCSFGVCRRAMWDCGGAISYPGLAECCGRVAIHLESSPTINPSMVAREETNKHTSKPLEGDMLSWRGTVRGRVETSPDREMTRWSSTTAPQLTLRALQSVIYRASLPIHCCPIDCCHAAVPLAKPTPYTSSKKANCSRQTKG